jgi:hypothetical protein
MRPQPWDRCAWVIWLAEQTGADLGVAMAAMHDADEALAEEGGATWEDVAERALLT